MGFGDAIMATGLARGFRKRGIRAAFGDGVKIKWDKHCGPIFQGNPNVAPPGAENAKDLEWIAHYKGKRAYNSAGPDRWIWNYDFRAVPGELFFDMRERAVVSRQGSGFAIIEPNVPRWKSVAPNKDWGTRNYQYVADRLKDKGIKVAQFLYGGSEQLSGVRQIATSSIRDALAILSNAIIYVGPEGGLHHGAAALGVRGVVIFGGFIPPAVTGYDIHTNLTGGADACGMFKFCEHCRAALARITPDEVFEAAVMQMKGKPV